MDASAGGDGVVLDGEKILVPTRQRPTSCSSRPPTAGATSSTRGRGGDDHAGTVDRPHPPALLGRFDGVGVAARTPCRPRGPSTSRSSSASASPSPPSRPGSPSGRWRCRSSTPRTASSSAGRSAPTRPSPTAARRCCWRPRIPARPSTAPPGPPTPTRHAAAGGLDRQGLRLRRRLAGPDAAIQVHGGIGFTWEHDLHFFLKRGRANAAMFGDSGWHRERVADLSSPGPPSGRVRAPER